MRNKIWFLVCTILVLVGAGCRQKTEAPVSPEPASPATIDIAVSIYPLAHFAKKVGGDKVNVHLITPGGVEPHEYEPTPSDIIKIQSSKAFVFNGAGVDVWAGALEEDLKKKGITVLEMTDYLDDHSPIDPHIWLDPVLAQEQIEIFVQLLVALDPGNRTVYEKNGALSIAELLQLDQDYKNTLSQCSLKDIVVSHDAFGYVGTRYGITIHPIAGLSPEEEPSAARLAELSRLMKEKNIKIVFFETLVTPKLAQTLAKEVGAEVFVLNPIEGISDKENKAGENYDTLMRENLNNLKIALVCR